MCDGKAMRPVARAMVVVIEYVDDPQATSKVRRAYDLVLRSAGRKRPVQESAVEAPVNTSPAGDALTPRRPSESVAGRGGSNQNECSSNRIRVQR